jgi:hypothetical protein
MTVAGGLDDGHDHARGYPLTDGRDIAGYRLEVNVRFSVHDSQSYGAQRELMANQRRLRNASGKARTTSDAPMGASPAGSPASVLPAPAAASLAASPCR